MSRPTLAVWKFASCDGCQLSLLDCEDELLAVAEQVEIAYFLEASSATVEGPYDVSIVEGDALALDWSALVGQGTPWRVVANLPYNVATPLVIDLLDHVPAVSDLFVMVQREAGERLVASPGSKTYGSPSVKVAYWAHAELVGTVPPTVFYPRPKVESALVRITRRDALLEGFHVHGNIRPTDDGAFVAASTY